MDILPIDMLNCISNLLDYTDILNLRRTCIYLRKINTPCPILLIRNVQNVNHSILIGYITLNKLEHYALSGKITGLFRRYSLHLCIPNITFNGYILNDGHLNVIIPKNYKGKIKYYFTSLDDHSSYDQHGRVSSTNIKLIKIDLEKFHVLVDRLYEIYLEAKNE